MSEYKINATITFANIDEADAFADFLQDTLAETPEAIEELLEKLLKETNIKIISLNNLFIVRNLSF